MILAESADLIDSNSRTLWPSDSSIREAWQYGHMADDFERAVSGVRLQGEEDALSERSEFASGPGDGRQGREVLEEDRANESAICPYCRAALRTRKNTRTQNTRTKNKIAEKPAPQCLYP